MLLVVEGPGLDCEEDALPLRVEFPQVDIPQEVREKMAELTLKHWRSAVAAAAGGGGGSGDAQDSVAPRWRLQETLLVSGEGGKQGERQLGQIM